MNKFGSEVIYSKSSLKKIDWRIVVFLIDYLYHNPYEKKTNLAMKVGLQYSRFMRYIDWMCLIDWIEFIEKDGFKVIKLSSVGRSIFRNINSRY